MGRITLVAHLFQLAPFQLTGASLDGPLDVVFGHVSRPRLIDGQPQRRIGTRITAAFPGRHRDFSGYAGEDLATLGIFSPFFAFDG